MIAVLGGTGMAGRPVVEMLARAGANVRCISRSTPEALPQGVQHRAIDLRNPDGTNVALEGASTVLDLMNSPTRPGPLHLDATQRLLETARQQGIEHFVGISIVGCEDLNLGYYKAKAKQADLVRGSQVPWTLLCATQFHEFLDGVFTGAARFGLTPSGAIPLQPIAAGEVARELVRITEDKAAGDQRISGPEVLELGELAALWKTATGKRSLRLPVPGIGRTMKRIKAGAFCDQSARQSGETFSSWLAERRASAS